jgi:hypothetical protein
MEWPNLIIIPLGERSAWPFHRFKLLNKDRLNDSGSLQGCLTKRGFNKKITSLNEMQLV